MPGSEIVITEPVLITTANLKVAYIFKVNEFNQHTSVMETSSSIIYTIQLKKIWTYFYYIFQGNYKFKYNCKKMMVVSVSLNKTEIKMSDLKIALPLSQLENQLKISDYFIWAKSISDPEEEH